MENKVKETDGMERFRRLQAEAKELGITGHHKADEFEALIAQVKIDNEEAVIVEPIKQSEKSAGSLTPEEAEKIDVRLRYEDDLREKFRVARRIQIDRASIIAESEKLKIKVDLPEKPTELELARARVQLGIKKIEVKPSPETVVIETSKRGYYVFTNREQDDAAHTVNPGGKYTIHLIPDQVHVLSEAHIRLFRKFAVVPVYKRVPVAGPPVEGQMGEECKRVGSKQRFSFEKLGEAPQDAPFGLVTDTKILDKLRLKEEQLV